MANTAVKAALVWVQCGGRMAWHITGLTALMTATAAAAWLAAPG